MVNVCKRIRIVCLLLVFVLAMGFVLSGCVTYVYKVVHPALDDSLDYIDIQCVDGLGRVLPTYADEDVGAPKENKEVGIFYHIWHASHTRSVAGDVTSILKKHPTAAEEGWGSPYWNGDMFFWDEPIYGYYQEDKWVYRRQAELLAMADIDVIIFDATNGTELFLDALDTLCEAFMEAKEAGFDVPKFMYMLPFWSEESCNIDLRSLYNNVYGVGKYQDLWYYWDGKPMVLGVSQGLDPYSDLDKKIIDTFVFRKVQDSYFAGQDESVPMWGWLEIYPQTAYTNYGVVEEVTVGVAQNYSQKRGLTSMNAGDDVYGRSWSVKAGGKSTIENSMYYGINFAEQWEYALQINPRFIFVTGWNEWVAGRFSEWEGIKNAFPDEYNDEYSRDIEPSAGELKDYYYYQLCSYVRKFKGTEAPTSVTATKEIDIHGSLSQWDEITATFQASTNNIEDRDHVGYNRRKYKNTTGRNDIASAKIAYDNDYVYFYVSTVNELTSTSDDAWMRLFIDIDGQPSGTSDWEGYEFIVNRENVGANGAVLERSTGGWNWEKVADLDYSVNGNVLQIKISRADLGITDKGFTINFKWSDNMQEDGNIMDFYVNGDVAPLGRFNYSLATAKE